MSAREPLASQAFYGLNFRDAEIAWLTKKVVLLASIAAAVAFINQIWGLAASAFFPFLLVVALFNMLLALAVPFCGWQGAKKNDKNMICCFCGCNFISGVGGAIGFINFISGDAIINAVINIPFTILACASFWYGKQLYDHLDKGLLITVVPAYPAMNHNLVQPGAGGAADV